MAVAKSCLTGHRIQYNEPTDSAEEGDLKVIGNRIAGDDKSCCNGRMWNAEIMHLDGKQAVAEALSELLFVNGL